MQQTMNMLEQMMGRVPDDLAQLSKNLTVVLDLASMAAGSGIEIHNIWLGVDELQRNSRGLTTPPPKSPLALVMSTNRVERVRKSSGRR
jgi:hypothetical protein